MATAIEVLKSKKGTKVVTASNLHQSLGLPFRQYGAQVRRWLRDVYEFSDGIRRPEPLRDFAARQRANRPTAQPDFYLTLELAKLVALRTDSKEKLKLARLLEHYAHTEQLSLF